MFYEIVRTSELYTSIIKAYDIFYVTEYFKINL